MWKQSQKKQISQDVRKKKIDKRQPVATKCAKIQKHMVHPGTSLSYLSSERMDCKSLLQSAMKFPSMAMCFLEPASSALSWRIQKSPSILAILGFQISHRAPQSIQNSAETKSTSKITPQDDQNAQGMRKNPEDEAGTKLPLIPFVSLLNNSVSRTTSHAKPWQTTRTPWPGTTVPLQTHEGRKQLRRSSSQNPREVSRATFSVRLSITFHIISFPFSCIICIYLCVTSLLHPFSSMVHSSNNSVQLTSFLQLHSASVPFRKLQMEILQLLTVLVQYSQSKNGCETQLVIRI